eukprot:1153961-Pelagomonas_calceolata.AAC.9
MALSCSEDPPHGPGPRSALESMQPGMPSVAKTDRGLHASAFPFVILEQYRTQLDSSRTPPKKLVLLPRINSAPWN